MVKNDRDELFAKIEQPQKKIIEEIVKKINMEEHKKIYAKPKDTEEMTKKVRIKICNRYTIPPISACPPKIWFYNEAVKYFETKKEKF